MGSVITFPGGGSARVPDRPKTIADLPAGTKALAIVKHGTGFAVVLRPAVTAAERSLRRVFSSKPAAEGYARSMSIAYFQLYRLILDETAGGAA